MTNIFSECVLNNVKMVYFLFNYVLIHLIGSARQQCACEESVYLRSILIRCEFGWDKLLVVKILWPCLTMLLFLLRNLEEKLLQPCWHLNKTKSSIKSPEQWKSNLWAITLSSRNVYPIDLRFLFFFLKTTRRSTLDSPPS